jgi:hypothetical protein
MARPLRRSTPTSAVSRLLDMEAADRALAPSAAKPATAANVRPQRSAVPAEEGRPCIKRELVLTLAADRVLSELVVICRAATGTRCTTSHVARSLLRAVELALPHIAQQTAAMGPISLPSNAPRDAGRRQHFEDRLAAALLAGFSGPRHR